MRKEWAKRIICIGVALLIFFFVASQAGCSQFDLEIGARASARQLQENESADSRQPGVFGNLGR